MNVPAELELVTEIMDSGKGIEEERIEYLFILFGELKKKRELRKVKDLGIGVGLSTSKELCHALGGKVKLLSSIRGCTKFEIRIPVTNHTQNARSS